MLMCLQTYVLHFPISRMKARQMYALNSADMAPFRAGSVLNKRFLTVSISVKTTMKMYHGYMVCHEYNYFQRGNRCKYSRIASFLYITEVFRSGNRSLEQIFVLYFYHCG